MRNETQIIGMPMLLALLFVMVTVSGIILISYADNVSYSRARECSHMLHGYSRGSLVPLTADASEEIGACLLLYNQPIAGGDE